MSALTDLFGRLHRDIKRAISGRTFRRGDPSNGLSYNKINETRMVSRRIYSADIARTPQVIKDISNHVDVHASAWSANSHRAMVDYMSSKFRGRNGRW